MNTDGVELRETNGKTVKFYRRTQRGGAATPKEDLNRRCTQMDADGMSDRPAELPPNEAIKAKQWDIVTTKQSKYANVLTGLTEWTGWKIPRKRRGRAHVR
jgi:hypothetical protein